MIILLLLVIVIKYIFPTFKYLRHIILVVLILSAVNFGYRFLQPIINDDGFNPLPIMFMGGVGFFIYRGGRNLSFKTRTGIWDTMHNKLISFLTAGQMKWVIPWLETTSIRTDGVEGETLNLKTLPFGINETPEILTNKPGVRAVLTGISGWVDWDDKDLLTGKDKTGDAKRDFERRVIKMFNVDGGVSTVFGRLTGRTLQILHDRVGKVDPEALDSDKGHQVRLIAQQLKDDMNNFLFHDDSPFRIRKDFTIQDTELDVNYYNTLMKQEIARITAIADDITADKLGKRLVALGNELLKDMPGVTYTSAQRKDAALVALGIVKKEEDYRRFGLDPDTAMLVKAIAGQLKRKAA